MLYLIVGKTSTGKDTVARHLHSVESGFNIKPCVSYATRPMRESDVNGVNHYFITDEQMDKIENSNAMLAYTKNPKTGIRYGLPSSELSQRNVSFIVNPEGIKWMKEHAPLAESEYRTIYLDLDESIMRERAIARGDDPATFEERLNSEREEFDSFLAENKDEMLVINTAEGIDAVLTKVDAFVAEPGNYHLEKDPIEYKFGYLDEAIERLHYGQVDSLADVQQIRDALKINISMLKEPEREIEVSEIELLLEKYEQLFDEQYNETGYNVGDIKLALRDNDNVRVPEFEEINNGMQMEFSFNSVSRKVAIAIKDENDNVLCSEEKDYDEFINTGFKEFTVEIEDLARRNGISIAEAKAKQEELENERDEELEDEYEEERDNIEEEQEEDAPEFDF